MADGTNEILQALGRIEGTVMEIRDAAREHRDDDKRRFTEVHSRLDQYAEDINKAKGAKGALLWAAAGIASVVGFVAPYIAKVLGLK